MFYENLQSVVIATFHRRLVKLDGEISPITGLPHMRLDDPPAPVRLALTLLAHGHVGVLALPGGGAWRRLAVSEDVPTVDRNIVPIADRGSFP